MSARSLPLFLAGAALVLPAMLAAAEKPLPLADPEAPVVLPLNAAGMNRLSLVALSGTPYKVGGFLPAFDRKLDTAYEAREAGPAHIDLSFAKPLTLHAVRLLPGGAEAEWSLAAADSQPELENGNGSFRYVVAPRKRATDEWDEVRLPAPVTARVFRLKVTPKAGATVRIRECNLLAAQTLEAISVKPPSYTVEVGEPTPLEVMGYFSGGETHAVKARGARWTLSPAASGRMTSYDRLVPRRRGPLQISVTLGKLAAPPVTVEVVDAD